VNCARTDLGGGRSEMGVPTATDLKFFQLVRSRRVHRRRRQLSEPVWSGHLPSWADFFVCMRDSRSSAEAVETPARCSIRISNSSRSWRGGLLLSPTAMVRLMKEIRPPPHRSRK